MHQSQLVLADVLTFLSFLHSNDVAPRHQRFLIPTHVARLVPLMTPDEALAPKTTRTRQPRRAKRLPTELHTQRLRFVHFLCEAAGLVAPTQGPLKPTPRTATETPQRFTDSCYNSKIHLPTTLLQFRVIDVGLRAT